MNKRFEIVIVGAGVTGLTVASLLAQSEVAADFKIRVIDAAQRPTWDSGDDVALRVSAVSGLKWSPEGKVDFHSLRAVFTTLVDDGASVPASLYGANISARTESILFAV